MKRPTVYVIAEELVEKGIIMHVPGEEKKRYIARMPDVFIEEQEERLQAARKILPELRSFQKGTAEKASILYFEGTDGLRQAHQYKQKELQGKDIVGFFASPDDVSHESVEVFKEWNAYKARHNIHVRGITVDHPDLSSFKEFFKIEEGGMLAKYLPKKLYDANVSIESCNGKFVRICFMESAETLIIESQKFAAAIKDVFELLWKSLEGKYDAPQNVVLESKD